MQNPKEACKAHCWQKAGANTLRACCAGTLLIEIIEIIGQACDDHGLQAARSVLAQLAPPPKGGDIESELYDSSSKMTVGSDSHEAL